MKPKSSDINYPLATPALKTFILDLYSERVFGHEIGHILPPLHLTNPTCDRSSHRTVSSPQDIDPQNPSPSSRARYHRLADGFSGISCELQGDLSCCIDTFFAAQPKHAGSNAMHLVVGALSDPLSPSPQQLPAWLKAFELMVQANPAYLTLQTRSALVLLLLPLFKKRPLQTSVTIAIESLERGVASSVSPGSAPPFERMRLIKTLARLGVQTTAQITPCFRTGTAKREARQLVEAVSDTGCGIRIVPLTQLAPSLANDFSKNAHLILEEELGRRNISPFESWSSQLDGGEDEKDKAA